MNESKLNLKKSCKRYEGTINEIIIYLLFKCIVFHAIGTKKGKENSENKKLFYTFFFLFISFHKCKYSRKEVKLGILSPR